MTQTDAVLKHLKTHRALSSLEAMNDYGIMRLSAIIFVLRDRGYDIETQKKTTKNRYGSTSTYANYILNEQQKEEKR